MLSGEQTETYLLDKLKKKKAPSTNIVFQQHLFEFMDGSFHVFCLLSQRVLYLYPCFVMTCLLKGKIL